MSEKNAFEKVSPAYRESKIKLLPLAKAVGAALVLSASTVYADELLQLEEVVVTAQKRSQSLQDIPMSVSALSEDALKNAGISSVEDVKHAVPALNITSSNSPAQSSIAIRGAGTGAADPTLEPSVGVFVDGVFMPRSIFGLSDLVDIDRIEVLLGPQGTLYGKNTNSGVISVHTKGRPDEFEFTAEQNLGSENLQDTQLSLGGAINDDMGYRFAARSNRRDGIMDDELTGREYNQIDKQSYRAQFFWDPSESLSTRAIAYYSLNDANQSQAEDYIPGGSAYAGYLSSVLGAAVPEGDPTDREVSHTQATGGRVEVQGASYQLEYEFDSGYTLTSISAYQEWEQDNSLTDNDGSALDASTSRPSFNEESISQEVRIASPGGETIDWLAGMFYFKSDLEGGSKDELFSTTTSGLPGVPSSPALGPLSALPLIAAGDSFLWHQTFRSESFAVFGQATWNISEQTSLTAGIRFGDEEKEFSVYTDSFDADGTPFRLANFANGSYTGGTFIPLISGQVGVGGALDQSDDRSDSDVTGMISLNHFIGEHMVYATIASGSKSGGFNGSFGAAALEDREYESEETINYEIGAKMDLMDGRARLNLAYFYTEYKDFQATTFDPQTIVFGVVNAGKQVTQGVDLDATYLASENLTLSLKLEYLDARYKDFDVANCAANSGELITASGCVLDDERMESAPNWSGTFAADYIYPLDDGEVYAHGNLAFKTEHISDPTRNAASVDTRYELLNARVGWRNDTWDVSLWGKNLTDDYYATGHTSNLIGNLFAAADGGLSSDSYRRWVNDPRTWGVSVRYRM